ncbi:MULTISPECIES: archaetidylserine decarboxylase [Myxococcus]|uniref:Phosphatidylserine decarboxylase proenzyme n=1 Tax=Myxococcus xanthus TaxID=34 RepID=A0AAE6G0S2_MYXXA|nr:MULTISPECIES: archaetidylserine decarboxylase [Myxococcus]QDE68787.1 phosphatidylserine decarboxylase [Myxococcus xanthus]QDE76063.1 phosphatidylserine decarboxylase [Myxococcus xanthus]QDE83489.1 phosphatidylserine decarboxylase [Myxococcus xanthus]WAM30166.1 archaetidylserine decarboxylase [Myxococcus sp. NMCA1]
MNDQTFMKLMQVLPKSALSTVVGMATRLPVPAPVHQAAMRAFAKAYNVDMEEAEHSFDHYPTFAQFFTRGLKPGLRPVDAGEKVVVSPVDGRVSQVGYSDYGRCLQAKGIEYTVDELLGDSEAAKPFHGGAWTTIYLSPRDYHRIHAPLGGTITGYAYIPGEFWPVNPASVKNKQSLFCVNERLVTYLDTVAGKCAVVKVGATCVSRIKAAYDEVTTHTGQPGKVHRYGAAMPVEKGGELGRFEMGSTVILLFEPKRVTWDDSLQEEAVVRLGKRIGAIT